MTSTSHLNPCAGTRRTSIESSVRSRAPGCPRAKRGVTAAAFRAGLFGFASLIALAAAPHQAAAQTISVFPDGQAISAPTSSTIQTANFGLVGLVSGQTYFREIFCTGEVINCGSATPEQFTAPKNSISVTYFTTNTGGPGRIFLKVYKAGMTPMDTGWFNVTVTPTDVVSDLTANNNANQDMGLCAASCFAPVYSQGTVPYYSLGAARNVTLVYHGDRAAPNGLLYTNASISTSRTVSEYWLEATRSTGAHIKFANGDTVIRFAGTNVGQVRLGGRFYPDSNVMAGTAMSAVGMLVTAKFTDGTTQRQRFSPQVMVIDERKSPVARGWTIAGLQHLYAQTGGSVLITDGTGSAAYFTNDCGAGCYTSPVGDFSRLTSSGGTYVRAYPDSTKANFNGSGQLTDLVDSFGNTTSFEYVSGRLTKIYDPFRTYNSGANRSYIALTYGTYGLSQIQEPGPDGSPTGGRITSITVASDSTLRVFKDPDGDSTRFVYDGSRRLSTVYNRRGDSTSYSYDGSTGKLAWVDLPMVTLYSGNARPRVQYSAWQPLGVPTGSTGTTTATPVLTSNLQGSTTDPLGHTATFRPNQWGQPLSVTDPMSRVTTINRNGGIFPSSIVYPEGGTDNFSFAGGLLTSQTLAGQPTANFHYGAYAQADSAGGTGWASARASIGPGGRVDWTRVGPDDSLRVYHFYDTRGRVARDSDQAGHVTIYHYDAKFGNLDSVSAPGNRYTKVLFDGYGRDSAQQSNNEPQRRTLYDVMNRVVQAYDGVNTSPTSFTYDKLFLTRVQDAKGQVYRFKKNALGWTERRYDPADTLTRYDSATYDAGGQLHSWTNRRGQQINYAYDALGRLTSKSGTNTSTDSLSYSTDGKITVMWNAVERDSVIADSTGWVKSVITRVSGQRFQIDYKPNSIQQVDSVLVSGGGITFAARHYGWNRTFGTLDTISVNDSVTTLVRQKDLMLPRQTIWPSLTRTDDWTAIHRPSQSTFSVASVDSVLSRRYSYNSRFGMQDYITQQGSNWRTRQRTYDGLRRLGAIGDDLYAPSSCALDAASGYLCPASTQATVTFDAVGNRTDAPDTMYTTGNRMTRFNGYTYAYDLDGNDTNKVNIATSERKSYEWSADGLLNRVLVNGVEKVRFEYNAGGQLVRRYTNGTLDRTYLWGGGQLIAELNASANQRVSEYAYSPGADLPFAIVTGATSISAVRYHLIDEVGNVIGVMNGSSVDEQISYDDWGVATTTGNTDNRLMFKGLLWEPDAGLYYMRARWYDPGSGRFMSEDPVGLAGGINPYVFSGQDPINGSDPSGLCFICWRKVGRALGKIGPAVGFAAIVAAELSLPGVGLGAAALAAGKAVGAAALGSGAAALVEAAVGGGSFGRAFQRNFNIAGWMLAGDVGIATTLGGGFAGAGQYHLLQGYVRSKRALNIPFLRGLNAATSGSSSIYFGVRPIDRYEVLRTYGGHEFGHTLQLVGMSALGGFINPWIPYATFGALGAIDQFSPGASAFGAAWESSATFLGRLF
jgi:RHS repeat-associated protein